MNEDPDVALGLQPAPTVGRLKITEIFLSIQGEAASVGWPTVFVRLTGCPLRCQYCDTQYAFHGGSWASIPEILAQVAGYSTARVCVTGGEPLAQRGCPKLLAALCEAGYQVSLETSGALDIADVDSRVARVVDVKTPGSGEHSRNRLENFHTLQPTDQLKFVICNREDYEWSREMLRTYALDKKCTVLFSPSYRETKPEVLAQWILDDRLAVRLQVQLHKYLWGETPGT